jgi:hypothetical protein
LCREKDELEGWKRGLVFAPSGLVILFFFFLLFVSVPHQEEALQTGDETEGGLCGLL